VCTSLKVPFTRSSTQESEEEIVAIVAASIDLQPVGHMVYTPPMNGVLVSSADVSSAGGARGPLNVGSIVQSVARPSGVLEGNTEHHIAPGLLVYSERN